MYRLPRKYFIKILLEIRSLPSFLIKIGFNFKLNPLCSRSTLKFLFYTLINNYLANYLYKSCNTLSGGILLVDLHFSCNKEKLIFFFPPHKINIVEILFLFERRLRELPSSPLRRHQFHVDLSLPNQSLNYLIIIVPAARHTHRRAEICLQTR